MKNGNKVTIQVSTSLIKQTINFREVNLTRLNYMHNHNIVDSVNVIKQFEDLTMVQEEPGEYHMKPQDLLTVKNQLVKSIDELKESTSEKIVEWTHKGITYILMSIVIGSIILACLRKRRRKQTQNENETIFIQEIKDKYANIKV